MSAVRPARAADLDAVAAIESSRPGAPGWTRAQFASELGSPAALFLVAEADGAPAGYALCRIVPPEARLLTIAVAAAAEGKGLGRRLLQETAAAARGRGLSSLTLEVSERNARARRLYERLGLRVVGRRKKFYPDATDALLMDLPL